MKKILTIEDVQREACAFSKQESSYQEPTLYGVTDGKAVGTYLEHKFQAYLHNNYQYVEGNSARGIDFPELFIDMKVTSIRQPQSSCPFKSAKQKVYGLGYNLLVFVYEKEDDDKSHTAKLNILHTIFIDKNRTADFQTTSGLNRILDNQGNIDDVLAFFSERMLPADDIQTKILAEEVLQKRPAIGYLTISNALQWRLQYRRVIEKAGAVSGVISL